MSERLLGNGFTASAVSYGAMGLSEFYGTAPPDEISLTVLENALNFGVTMLDTADMYGFGHNENLIGRFLKNHKADLAAGRIKVATKFGIERNERSYKRRINNSPAYIRLACENSLKRLGLERIDLYYVHRVAEKVDIADTIGVLAELMREGKIANLGLCEISAQTLAQAHKVHPITAVQSEYSLWTRDVEADILPLCSELGIGFVAYSPLGRGFLSGRYESVDKLDETDFRRSNPRFIGENFQQNLRLLEKLKAMAQTKECSPAQLALAWLLGKSETLVAIPGTRQVDRLKENSLAADISLSSGESELLEDIFSPDKIQGQRYTQEGMKGIGA